MSGASPLVPGAHGYRETRRVEFLVDLRRDRDSLWKAIRKDQRERIRRLEREGVSVEATTRPEDIQGLASVRQATREKRSERGQVYEVRADETFSADLYDHLVKQGAARLFVARRAGDVLAALFFVTFNDRAYSVYSGSTEAGYRIGAQSGLFWTAVERFKDEGFELLNRGGVPASAEDESHPLHGIYLFKLRLGTTPTVCRSGTKVLSKFRDRLVRLRAGLRG
jgi:lipid II:glycine glycyltransferase (peptidoglycan interpeptide bridge formation enzyme)